nr:WbqC family protein [Arcticibacter svalbardensis]
MSTNIVYSMHKGAIFPSFYLPPVEYFSQMKAHNDQIIVEGCEHYKKQTFRSRATIHSPQGKLDLIIPVLKGANLQTDIKDVKISYDFDWQRLHWQSIQTAYRRSAYFEYYEDDFKVFYTQKWEFLFDYNMELLDFLIRNLKLDLPYTFSTSYEEQYVDLDDYRDSIHPKRTPISAFKPYFQVFDDRNGFIPNLTVVDLLFNQGPQSSSYL